MQPPDSSPRSYDVAIVGAGPAGSAAALFLARAGARVALIEKERWPRYKTCGGGVVARGRDVLPADVAIPVEHACRAAEAHFLESDLHFRVERETPIVSMTMRAELDRSIADAAVASGAELLSECALIELREDGGGVDLETARGTMRAGCVVGADGVLSTVARKAGWTQPVATMAALEAEVRVTPGAAARFAGTARFDFEAMPKGYGWVFPKRDHLSCGVLTTERGIGGLHAALDRYLERVGIGARIAEERHGYLIPVRPRREGCARGRVLLAGDAAGFADALTGEGITIAMRSGRIAAEALIEAGFGAGAAALYERRLRRSGFRRELWIARMLAWVLYRRPKLAREAFRRRGETLCEAMTDVFVGRRTYASLVAWPGSYVRLARRPRRSARTATSA